MLDPRFRALPLLSLLVLAGCGGGGGESSAGGDPAVDPAPVGAEVGATGADATAAPAAPGDTSARTGSHP